MKFEDQINRLAKKIDNRVKDKAEDILGEVVEAVVIGQGAGQEHPVDTGQAVNGWEIFRDYDFNSFFYDETEESLAEGEKDLARREKAKELLPNIRRTLGGHFILSNHADYIKELEYDGKSTRYAPDGWIEMGVEQIRNKHTN